MIFFLIFPIICAHGRNLHSMRNSVDAEREGTCCPTTQRWPRPSFCHIFSRLFPTVFWGSLYKSNHPQYRIMLLLFCFFNTLSFFISLCPRKLLASMVFSLPGGKKEIFTGPPVLTGEIQTLSHGFPLHPTFTNSRTLHAEL